jgi:uncharacterized membrane protein YhaH (DUF805 family)
MPPLAERLFSFRGRIPRSTFFVTSAQVLAAFAVLMVFLDSVVGGAARSSCTRRCTCACSPSR